MVIFHSYVKLPEGKSQKVRLNQHEFPIESHEISIKSHYKSPMKSHETAMSNNVGEPISYTIPQITIL